MDPLEVREAEETEVAPRRNGVLTMKLIFIGKEGSMGLKRGEVYDVTIFTEQEKIVVRLGPHRYCPYSSPQALAANWAKEETAVVVRCKNCTKWKEPWLMEQTLGRCCRGKGEMTGPEHFCGYGERRSDHG